MHKERQATFEFIVNKSKVCTAGAVSYVQISAKNESTCKHGTKFVFFFCVLLSEFIACNIIFEDKLCKAFTYYHLFSSVFS